MNENAKNTAGSRNSSEDCGFFHAQNSFSAVSLSGGKDSSCLLLLMLEKGMPIDAVLTADTGMEFPEMAEHLAKLDDLLYRERGLHITTLRHPHGFEWLMFEEPKQKPSSVENRTRRGIPLYGNGWPSVQVRWCTGQLKTHLINKEVNRLKGKYNALHYVGIAADEAHRCKKEQYPLVEWGITEAQALQYCYDRGFDFGGLYAAHPAGAAPFNEWMSYESCAATTRSCGRGYWIWTIEQERCSAPARWGLLSKTGLWNATRSVSHRRI